MRMLPIIMMSIASLLPISSFSEDILKLERNTKLTLSDVISQALLHSPKQREIEASNGLIEAKSLQVSSFLPGSPAISAGHQNDIVGSNRNLNQWEIGIELPIWMPGQRAARESTLNALTNELVSNRNNLSLEIAGQVRDAIWNISMVTVDVDLAEAQYKNALDLQHDVEKRWKAGELARTDFMLSQNGALLAKAVYIKTQAEVKHAEHRYWMLTGLKELPEYFDEKLNSKNVIDENHPLLSEAVAKIEMANKQRALIAIESRENPQIMLNVRHERGAFDSLYNDSVGVLIRVPIDSKVRSAPMLASADMAIAQASSEREQRQRMLESSFHEAEHNLETIREEIAILEEQNQISQASLQLSKKSFNLGETDLINLLRSQANAYESRTQFNESSYTNAMEYCSL